MILDMMAHKATFVTICLFVIYYYNSMLATMCRGVDYDVGPPVDPIGRKFSHVQPMPHVHVDL